MNEGTGPLNLWSLMAGIPAALASAWRKVISIAGPYPDFDPQIDPIDQNFGVSVMRGDDLLVAHFFCFNLALLPAAGSLKARLVRATEAEALLAVAFPPQSFGEEAVREVGVSLPAPPLQVLIGGPSWIVARIEPGQLPIPYTAEGLLDALRNGTPVIREGIAQPLTVPGSMTTSPGRLTEAFTAIEAPYRLVLSPGPGTGWAHASLPVTNEAQTRTELWHTRLGMRAGSGVIDEVPTEGRVARAVWSPDYTGSIQEPTTAEPFTMSLTAKQRHQLVRLMSDTSQPGYVPSPARVDRLMVSALGAWLNVHGEWKPPYNMDVSEWQHVMTMGRDQFVRIVQEGHAFPFGHLLRHVTITQRNLQTYPGGDPNGDTVAYLRQRNFIVVREPVREYFHRSSPFRKVEIKTRITPSLDEPAKSQMADGAGAAAFWPMVFEAGQAEAVDFQFSLVGTDWDGNTVEFTSPLGYVSQQIPAEADPVRVNLPDLVNGYNGAYGASSPPGAKAYNVPPDHVRRKRPMGAALLAYAAKGPAGDAALQTFDMVFGALIPDPKPAGPPHFLPALSLAHVDIPAVTQLLGTPQPGGTAIQYEPTYLTAGGDMGNPAEIFATVTGAARLGFDVQRAGGLVAPNINITGLSRAFGPVDMTTAWTEGGVAHTLLDGYMAPAIFGDVKILGGISLASILNPRSDLHPPADGADAAAQMPAIVTTRDANGITTTYDWNAGLSAFRDDVHSFKPGGGAGLELHARQVQPLDGPPTYTVTGELRDFTLQLLPEPKAHLADLTIARLLFTAPAGQKPDVKVEIGGFSFRHELSFVNALAREIPGGGFVDPPSLDILTDPDPGVAMGYSLGLPSVGFGMFTLQHIALAAGLYLPFGDRPANVHFAFCTREQPFTLTVLFLGGGGFFGIDVGIEGVHMVEAAFEFGASACINLGVASGSVSMMGGVYFQQAGGTLQFSAYFRANGELSVLGLISVCVEFYIGLNFQPKDDEATGGHLWGEATLRVKIKILFFSKTVGVRMERSFAGSDPTFADALAPAEWAEYCDAFADYA